MKIPLCLPDIDEKEIRAVEEVIKSGWMTDGPKNLEFEENFSKYIGVKKAVSLNSCASALQLAIKALSIKGEIIVPSFTFAASVNAIINAGATPVFADIDYDTCNIDPKDIKEKVTRRTEAIMVVHYAGQSCRMDEIMEISFDNNLKVIEDSAETVGGEYKGKKTGSFGIGCFSFFPTKNMTTGEGGMITTHDKQVASRIKILAGHGMSKTAYNKEHSDEPWLREALIPGYNYRMSSILAAIGVEQLKKIDHMNEKRRGHAAYLNERLRSSDIDLPIEETGSKHVYQMYTIKLKNLSRKDFIMKLREKGVMASVHFTPPVHLQDYYASTYKYKKGDLVVTEDVANRIVTLPMYPQLTTAQLDYIVQSIQDVLSDMKRRKRCP